MATLHLMVGLPCSGKTTEARRLERELGALRLTPDEWQTALFGDDAFEPEHDARHSTVERLLWNIARRALELGVDVILDYGFWAREERDALRAQARALRLPRAFHGRAAGGADDQGGSAQPPVRARAGIHHRAGAAARVVSPV